MMEKPLLQSKYVTRPCAVCNSMQSRPLFQQTFSQLSNGGSLLSGYDVVVCSKCGFCFADKIPDQEIFDAYYRDMSKYEKAERGGQDSPYDQARFQAMAKVILRYLSSTRVRIFEVGCANGQLLALLKNSGYENVSGIDPSPICAEIARERYNIRVAANTLANVPVDAESVDFLILAGVLEHVRELSPALQRLRQMLSAEGHIFITVPDASRYSEGKDAPFQEFSVEHINFFGPDSLTNLMKMNGFSLVSIEPDIIESNYQTTTSVIHGVFSKSKVLDPVIVSADTQTEVGLKLYIAKSNEIDSRIQAAIDKVVTAGHSIIVWGTGAHTLRLLAAGKLGEAKISAFVDSNPRYQEKSLMNIPIISPQALKDLREPILISSHAYQEEIAAQIRNDLQLNNEIIKLY